MKIFRTLLILSHRYIGIPLSLMFVLWFASAFVMIYVGEMPTISSEMRITKASSLDFSAIVLSPQQAAQSAPFQPDSVKLSMLLGRPLYVFQSGRFSSTSIFADNGEILKTLDEDQAQLIASHFLSLSQEQVRFVDTINEVDQWTISNRNDLPLLKFSANDGLGSELYVSPSNANVAVYTTTQTRLLAWLGTIPHWLYFTSLRSNQPLWYDLVIWSSGIGCLMAFLGLILSVTQFRKVRPFRLSRAIPYQGWMRWHYILGTVFGVFMLTWAFSGLLSMEPFAWTNARGLNVDRTVYVEGELDLQAFPELSALNWESLIDGDIKELDFSWIQGQPYLLASYINTQNSKSGQVDELLINAQNFSRAPDFEIESLVNKLDQSVSEARVLEYELLHEFDDYYYSRNTKRPLPILRIKFNDPAETWVYVDPAQSQLLLAKHKWSRVERWLYNGLHSLDFSFWYHSRPLWDIGVILLLLGGLISSGIGLYYGLRRLKNDMQSLCHLISVRD